MNWSDEGSSMMHDSRPLLTEPSIDVTPPEPVELTTGDKVSILMLGISCVIIVNAVYTDIDFFTEYLPNSNTVFMIPLCLNVPQVFSQLLAIKYLSSCPIKAVVMVMLTVSAAISLLLLWFVLTDVKEGLVFVSMIYFGFFMAIINSAAVGYVSSIRSPTAMGTFMFGMGINAMIVVALVLICILTLPDNLWQQSTIIFGSTAGIFLVTVYCFYRLTSKFAIRQSQVIKLDAIIQVYK